MLHDYTFTEDVPNELDEAQSLPRVPYQNQNIKYVLKISSL